MNKNLRHLRNLRDKNPTQIFLFVYNSVLFDLIFLKLFCEVKFYLYLCIVLVDKIIK